MKHVYAGWKKSCFWPYENTWALDGGSAGQGLSLNSSPDDGRFSVHYLEDLVHKCGI